MDPSKTMSASDRRAPVPIFAVRHDSDFAVAETVVIWDVKDCPLPDGLTPHDVFKNIKNVLRATGYHGNVTFRPYLDFFDDLLTAFEGIAYLPVDSEDREGRYKRFRTEIFIQAMYEHPNPLNLMVIIGDISKKEEFFEDFRVLQARIIYNIILVQTKDLSYDGILEGLKSGQALMKGCRRLKNT